MQYLGNLQNHFLIATPQVDDDFFERSVIYICEHNENGAMGLMITSPTDLSVLELLAKMDFLIANQRSYDKDQLVLSGGPVKMEHGFILHTATSENLVHSYPISDEIFLTTSGDILDILGTERAPKHFLITLGCATWQPNQLEEEIYRNDWLVAPSDLYILFEAGYLDRWELANQSIGVNGILASAGSA